LIIYVFALILRESFGNTKPDDDRWSENVTPYFEDVPRAMLTTFRCAFGDCSAATGVPIFEHVDTEYGVSYSLFYCGFVFTTTVGLFNVLSAVFVESTMASAAALASKKKKARLADQALWVTRINTIIKRILVISPDYEMSGRLSEQISDVHNLNVPSHIIDLLGEDPEAKQALEDLDINADDHDRLSTVLDPDNSGGISTVELLEGLQKLRGDPRRSDIVTVDLMLRAVQRDVTAMYKAIMTNQDFIVQESRDANQILSKQMNGAVSAKMHNH
jgi:hypothetical protein